MNAFEAAAVCTAWLIMYALLLSYWMPPARWPWAEKFFAWLAGRLERIAVLAVMAYRLVVPRRKIGRHRLP